MRSVIPYSLSIRRDPPTKREESTMIKGFVSSWVIECDNEGFFSEMGENRIIPNVNKEIIRSNGVLFHTELCHIFDSMVALLKFITHIKKKTIKRT